jgi:mannose-1-phosphate guanylyltransferase
VIADGSAIPRVDLADLIRRHRESGAAGTVVVEPRTTDGSVQPDSPVGIYVFNREALSLVPCSGFQDIKENLIPCLYREGHQVLSYRSATWTPRVLDSATYLTVSHWAVAEAVNGRIELPGFATLPGRPLCVAHETTRVDPSATIVGPVLLGAGVQVMANAVIIGPATIESDATVGAGAVVSRSVVGIKSVVDANAFLYRSVLGSGAHVVTGEQVSGSIRLPSQEVVARMRPKRLSQMLSRRLDPAFSSPA